MTEGMTRATVCERMLGMHVRVWLATGGVALLCWVCWEGLGGEGGV